MHVETGSLAQSQVTGRLDMGGTASIHIVDRDSGRRTQIARQLYSQQFHAEIYENVAELLRRPPRSGAILIYDDAPLSETFASLRSVGAPTGVFPSHFSHRNPPFGGSWRQ